MTRLRRIALDAGLVMLLSVGFPGPGAADGPGWSATEIRIGHIIAYSGPVSSYAPIGQTLTAFIGKVNDEGGINGRLIRLFSYDDGYNPARTVEQARRLVERDDVLLIFNSLGTAGNLAIRDYLNEAGVPQLFVASTSPSLVDPDAYPWTTLWGPSGHAQGLVFGRYAVDTVANPVIGVLYQNDDFGRDLLDGLSAGVAGRAPITALSYEVSDPSIDSQILSLRAGGANVLAIFATPRFASLAIRRAGEIGWSPLRFLPNVSASVSAVLEPAGFDHAREVVSVEYFMDPTDPGWADHPAMADWAAFMARHYPRGDRRNSNTVYGYILAQVLVDVLRRAGDDLSRENLRRVATGFEGFTVPQLLPGITVDTGPDDYIAIERFRMRRFTGTQWEAFGEPIDGSAAPGR